MEYLFRCKTIDSKKWVYGYYKKNINGVSQIADGCLYWHNVIPETVGIRIENEGFYVGDILHGEETDEYGSILSAWTGIVKYNPDKSRIMIQDDLEDWYEVDDFMYDEIIGTIFD